MIKRFHQLFESYTDNILDAKRVIDNFMDAIPCDLRISKGITLRDKHGVLILSRSTASNVQGDIMESGLLPVFSYGHFECTTFHINTMDYIEHTGSFLHEEHEEEVQELQNRLTAIFSNSDLYDIDIEERFIRFDIYKDVTKSVDVKSTEWEEICYKIRELDGEFSDNQLRKGITFRILAHHENSFFEFLNQYETDVPEDHLMMDKHKACKITNSSNGKDLILMFNAEDVFGSFNPEPTHLDFKVTSNDDNLSLYYLIDTLKDAIK